MRIAVVAIALFLWGLLQWAWGNFAYGVLWHWLEQKYGWQERQLRTWFLKRLPPLIPPLIIVIVAGFAFDRRDQLLGLNVSTPGKPEPVVATPEVASDKVAGSAPRAPEDSVTAPLILYSDGLPIGSLCAPPDYGPSPLGAQGYRFCVHPYAAVSGTEVEYAGRKFSCEPFKSGTLEVLLNIAGCGVSEAMQEQAPPPKSAHAERPNNNSGKPKVASSPSTSITGDCNQVANGDNNQQRLDCSKHYYAEPPRRGDGLYQNGIQIGDVQGKPEISAGGSTITFEALHFSAFVDQSSPIEFGDMKLNCPDAPVKDPHRFVGTLSVMIAGGRCNIMGRN